MTTDKKPRHLRFTQAQMVVLYRLKYTGEYRVFHNTPTTDALVRKGMIWGAWRSPARGKPGMMVYKLTDAGRRFMKC